jgi:hypothetical protein
MGPIAKSSSNDFIESPEGSAADISRTNMGRPDANDGSTQRADLDGRNVTTIIPEGATFTPKQPIARTASYIVGSRGHAGPARESGWLR